MRDIWLTMVRAGNQLETELWRCLSDNFSQIYWPGLCLLGVSCLGDVGLVTPRTTLSPLSAGSEAESGEGEWGRGDENQGSALTHSRSSLLTLTARPTWAPHKKQYTGLAWPHWGNWNNKVLSSQPSRDVDMIYVLLVQKIKSRVVMLFLAGQYVFHFIVCRDRSY